MPMSRYAVVVGSLNIDLVIQGERMPAKGESVLGNSFNTYPGGKGANQAVQLARLGLETYMIGRVGNDHYGEQLIRSLEEANVRTDFLIRDKAAGTGKGWVLVDGEGDNYIIVIPEANMRWQQRELDPLGQLIAGADVVLTQLEIPVPIVETIIHWAAQAQVMTVLNPSPARSLPDKLLRHVDVLVLNESEAAFYLDEEVDVPTDMVRLAQRLRRVTGVGTVILTLGAQGAVAVSGTEVIQTPAYRVAAIDVTAAGDAFCSSLAYALATGKRLQSAVQFACASGALAVTRPGAQPSLPGLREINDFMQQQGGLNGEENNL